MGGTPKKNGLYCSGRSHFTWMIERYPHDYGNPHRAESNGQGIKGTLIGSNFWIAIWTLVGTIATNKNSSISCAERSTEKDTLAHMQRTGKKDVLLNVSTICIIFSSLFGFLGYPFASLSTLPCPGTWEHLQLSPPPAVQDSTKCDCIQNQIHDGCGPCKPLDSGDQKSPGQRKSDLGTGQGDQMAYLQMPRAKVSGFHR